MKCTRCNKKLDKTYYWHIPICGKCRGQLINNKDFSLTKEELEIVDKRFKDEEQAI